MAKQRTYDDDDGRVVADMSVIEPRGIAESWFGIRGKRRNGVHNGMMSKSSKQALQPVELDKDDRKILVTEAIKMALKLGIIYVAVFGIAIALMILFWDMVG